MRRFDSDPRLQFFRTLLATAQLRLCVQAGNRHSTTCSDPFDPVPD
ncbi:MAG TPA: hypothetical protein VMF10_08010 [Candidatus Aquilonibacter sp.]|nr:hypothetical protein [Candidatus Aquilonibacter sp.]